MSPPTKQPNVTIAECDARRESCTSGRRWTVRVLVMVLAAVIGCTAALIADDRARSLDHERRISRLEATLTGNVKRLDRIESKIDRLLEAATQRTE